MRRMESGTTPRNSDWRSTLGAIAAAAALFAALVVAFAASNTLANMIPRDVVALHAEQSASSALVANRYEYGHRLLGGTVSYDNNRFILEVALQKDMGDPFSTMAVADIVDADKSGSAVDLQYFRYWHGWQLLTNACLALGTIDLVQIPAFLLTLAGTAAFFSALRRALGAGRAAAFCAALLLSTNLALNFMGDLLLSISFFTFLLLLSAGMLLRQRERLAARGFLVWTFGTGCVYSFLDFLTVPSLAAGLVSACALMLEGGNGRARLASAGMALLAFGAGYAAAWAAKWAVAAIVLSPEYVASNVLGEMGVWSSESDALPRPDWPQALQSFYSRSPRLFAICATAGYSLVADPFAIAAALASITIAARGALRMRKAGAPARREIAEALLLLAPCLVVLAYFLAMPTHAVVHIPVFGYKNWALVYAICLLAAMELGNLGGAPVVDRPQGEQEGMRDEYDFSESEPNPYCERVRRQ